MIADVGTWTLLLVSFILIKVSIKLYYLQVENISKENEFNYVYIVHLLLLNK